LGAKDRSSRLDDHAGKVIVYLDECCVVWE